MAVFLGLGAGVLVDAVLHQKLGEGVADLRGRDQVLSRDAQVPVVLEHPGVEDVGLDAPVVRQEETHVYVKKSQQYDDLKSSASAFLIVGGCLLVFSVLCWANVIPLPMMGLSRMISQSVMTVLGILSLIIAFRSMGTAKKVQAQVGEEEKTTKELVDWFLEQYSGDRLDRQLQGEFSQLGPEELSLKRFELIQDILVTHHDLADPSYVDLLTEEIYGKLYED